MERVQDPGSLGFYSRLFLVPKKNGKLHLVIRSFSAKSIHKERTIQDGDIQVSTTIFTLWAKQLLHKVLGFRKIEPLLPRED